MATINNNNIMAIELACDFVCLIYATILARLVISFYKVNNCCLFKMYVIVNEGH